MGISFSAVAFSSAAPAPRYGHSSYLVHCTWVMLGVKKWLNYWVRPAVILRSSHFHPRHALQIYTPKLRREPRDSGNRRLGLPGDSTRAHRVLGDQDFDGATPWNQLGNLGVQWDVGNGSGIREQSTTPATTATHQSLTSLYSSCR